MPGQYLYCIVQKPFREKLEITGIEGGLIYTIEVDNFLAVVSQAEIKEYLPTRENLIMHQRVIEEVLKKTTPLPVSFGTVTKNSDEIKKFLKNNTLEFLKIFKKIENKIELSLKVFWQNMDAIFEEIIKENREIQKARSNSRVSRNVMLAVGEMVAKALERKKIKEASLILQPLLKIAQEVKENELLRDDMILNVNFLVERSKEKDFDKAIDNLAEKCQKLKFKYIGPVAPVNFIQLQLKI